MLTVWYLVNDSLWPSGNVTPVFARFGSGGDLAPAAAPGSEAKNAAVLAMSSELSWAAMACMISVGLVAPGALRVPSFTASAVLRCRRPLRREIRQGIAHAYPV